MQLLMIILLATLSTGQLNARATEDIRFEHITTEEGLSQNAVLSILKDHHGYIWIATADGLNRFDGYEFLVYRNDEDDPTSLSDSYTTFLFEDDEGTLWIGTYNGVNRYQRHTNSFVRYTNDGEGDGLFLGNYVFRIFQDDDGKIWVATDEGVNRYLPESDTFARYPLSGRDPEETITNCHFVGADEKGIFAEVEDHIYYRYDSERDEFQQATDFPDFLLNRSLFIRWEDSRGYVWYSCYYAGAFRVSPEGDVAWFISNEPACDYTLLHNRISAFAEDRNGLIWLGTYGGIALYDYRTDQVSFLKNDPANPNSLVIDVVSALLVDDAGSVWVGTNGYGISVWKPFKDKFETIKRNPSNPNSLQHDYVYAVTEDADGDLWIGSYHGDVTRYQRDTDVFTNYTVRSSRHPEQPRTVPALLVTKAGKLIIGNNFGELFEYDPRSDSTILHFQGPQIQALDEDAQGNIILGHSFHGVTILDPQFQPLRVYSAQNEDPYSLAFNQVRDILVANDNSIWVGTEGGLTIIAPDRKSVRHYRHDSGNETSLSHNFIFSILQSRTGEIWLGTRYGINRYLPETDSFTSITMANGLPNNVIYSILEDREGDLWVGTNRGLARFDPGSGEIRSFTVADGLQSNEYNSNACYAAADGTLYFGGVAGVDHFDPGSLSSNNHVPPLELTAYNVLGVPESTGGILDDLTRIEQPHDRSFISLRFAALDYIDPAQNVYAYRLEPVSSNWIQLGNRRDLNLNLNPGTYTLQVIAANNDGIWNRTGRTIRIVIHPPFWQTWWFISIVVTAIVASIAGAVFLRIRSINQQRTRLEQEVAAKTCELQQQNDTLAWQAETLTTQTRDLAELTRELEAFNYTVSHDLRSPINRIRQYALMIDEECGERLSAESSKFLHRIVNNADQMSSLIDSLLRLANVTRQEMVWENIDLAVLARRIFNSFRSADGDRKVEIIADESLPCRCDSSLMEIALDNILSNSWKYTADRDSARIELSATQESGETVYEVRDNGIGFDSARADDLFLPFNRQANAREYAGFGIGLYTARRIIERHGGRIWSEGRPGRGASFFFTLGSPGAEEDEGIAKSADGVETGA